MYATAFACPGCRGSREPKLVSAMRWSFIFAGSIAAMAFATVLHSSSRWHGVRLDTGATDGPGPDDAAGGKLGVELGDPAGGALSEGVGDGATSAKGGRPHVVATNSEICTALTQPMTWPTHEPGE